jgi:TonB family protein
MSEAVSDIIVARARQPEGLGAMVIWSVAAHAAVIAGLMLMPERVSDEAPRTVMTISLGGAPGPKTQGITQMGGRAVQAEAPAEPPPKVAPPPAAAPPKMTLPDPQARPRPARPRPDRAPPDSNARTLSTGDKPREGSTRTETQVRGQGFGLSSSGGAGGPVTVDAVDFCCTEYLEQMTAIIQRNWTASQGMVGITMMKFTIRRNGELAEIQVERPSGFAVLDLASQRALQLTRQLPPLPARYPNPSLTVHMRFEYQR